MVCCYEFSANFPTSQIVPATTVNRFVEAHDLCCQCHPSRGINVGAASSAEHAKASLVKAVFFIFCSVGYINFSYTESLAVLYSLLLLLIGMKYLGVLTEQVNTESF